MEEPVEVGVTPNWDDERSQLSLPLTSDAWDVQLDGDKRSFVRLASGIHHITWGLPRRARVAGGRTWVRVEPGRTADLRAATPLRMGFPPQRPVIATLTPGAYLVEGEPLELRFWPADARLYEISVRTDDAGPVTYFADSSAFRQHPEAGIHTIRVRYLPETDTPPSVWSSWSRPLVSVCKNGDAKLFIDRSREAAHMLEMYLERDVLGRRVLTDIRAFPPACPRDAATKWFRTASFEGASPILNEAPDYYADPLRYYLLCIEKLVSEGARFVTWHDLLDDDLPDPDIAVLIQFDVDAGTHSMRRMYRELGPLGITASVMVHRRSATWYSGQVEDLLDVLLEAEKNGWAIGYHNNSLTEAQGRTAAEPSSEMLDLAQRRFADDVRDLRQWFDVRTFTNHGGNARNARAAVPEDIDVVPVDRSHNASIWTNVKGSFSDGAFLASPITLRSRVDTLRPGLHFFRNHPFKYANYEAPFDVPPLDEDEMERVGIRPEPALVERGAEELQKSEEWVQQRTRHHMSRRLGYGSTRKPLSRKLAPFSEVSDRVEKHRATRRPNFLRWYPWSHGDPRVFWWRLLHSFAPEDGEILNVGALPPKRRAENTDFLAPGVTVVEMDIDPARKPHVLYDITKAPAEMSGRFSCILLFGLGCIHTPSAAVDACLRLLAPGGLALFGFNADTHPYRGGFWNPASKPVWSAGKEPLPEVGQRGLQWSFEEEGLEDLFDDFTEVEIEFFFHHWFVLAKKAADKEALLGT